MVYMWYIHGYTMYLKTANSYNLRTVFRVYLKFLSKNCKQATPYARPSPAIAGTSGVHSNFIWPFGPWLFTKKNRKPALPPGSYNFYLNKIQLMLGTNRLNVI
jgi:hypothetical protein